MALADPVSQAVAPLLDGERTAEQIFERLRERFSPEEVFATLFDLQRRGLVVRQDGPEDRVRDLEQTWKDVAGQSLSPEILGQGTQPLRVAVESLGNLDPEPLVGLLKPQGFTLSENPQIRIILTDDYLRPELVEIDRRQRESGVTWMLVKPVGLEPWVGPFFEPPDSACWHCLAQRLRSHRPVASHLEKYGLLPFASAGPQRTLPAVLHLAYATAATQIALRAVGRSSICTNQILSIDSLTMERRQHFLTRRPQCHACGSLSQATSIASLELQGRRKTTSSDGGHRAVSAEATLERLERHVSPITGIISDLRPGLASRDGLVTSLQAEHPSPDRAQGLDHDRPAFRSLSAGKGKSSAQARISALAESLERYSGSFAGDEQRIRSSMATLGDKAVAPNTCALYSERQLRLRDPQWQVSKALRVPDTLHPETEIEWTPAWSLTNKRQAFLPTAYCYFNYPVPVGDPVVAWANSNGCAAGGCLEGAILQGFLELIERDAVAIWWYNRLLCPAVELGTGKDDYGPRLRDHYAHHLSRDLWVLDVRTDFPISVFAAVSRRFDVEEDDLILGFGAHLDPEVALHRALTEVNQSLEAVPGPGRRGYRGSREAKAFWQAVNVKVESYLSPDSSQSPVNLADFENLASDNLAIDVRTCVDLADEREIETLVLNQTRPDIGFPTVRVVAPGLRHFWARFGPGRLYDIPVELGRLKDPKEETELNPFVVYF